MKKLSLLLAGVLLLCMLTACGSNGDTPLSSGVPSDGISSQPDTVSSGTTTTQEDTTTVKKDLSTTDKASIITSAKPKTTTATTTAKPKPTLPMTATVSESPLSNTYKLLTQEKKLTIGYIGGSITLGTSASKDGGNLALSWPNRTTDWFKKKFPDAEITSVNSGISDTMSSLALYRLETSLMNTDGHDMPDLIFVEFTSNDWSIEIQGKEELRIQYESLFRRIRSINPAAEIVTVLSSRADDANSRLAYIEMSEYYGIPVVDAGSALKAAITERLGTANEVPGKYYYTTDNLHPNWRGYEIYLNECVKVFEQHLLGLTLKSNNLYAYGNHLPKPKCSNLITSPTYISPEKLDFSGDAKILNFSVKGNMFYTSSTNTQNLSMTPYQQQLYITGSTTVKTNFSGSTLGILMCPFPTGFNIRWRVDGGEWKNFMVSKNHTHAFMLYDRPIVFLLEYDLSSGNHALEMEFLPTTDGGELQMRLGGICVNGK